MHSLPHQNLNNRTFLGLLLAQFTAAFNDQAIHIVAIFYAVDILVRYGALTGVDDKMVVSIVTACFISPFLLFSPLAGLLADRFSKRNIIVFWKLAEVGMMTLALVGFLLPYFAYHGYGDMRTMTLASAVLIPTTVLMMGIHSTFFVPAKYGIMPEILHPSVLSRGNGLLEGSSFIGQIFGTSFGGILYSLLKPHVSTGQFVPGYEWVIGALLLGLAMIGTMTAFTMQPVPAAAPHVTMTWNWWIPLRENLKIVFGSRQLTLAIVGIAFAAFLTLFLRQNLLYQSEKARDQHEVELKIKAKVREDLGFEDPDPEPVVAGYLPSQLRHALKESELRVSLLISLVGFGVGLSSVFAGQVSGKRVELGLVPIGGVFIVLLTALLGVSAHWVWAVVVLLFGVGFAAGLYIVPLYTLMQHRAPKKSKGNVVAASNFLNIAGGILAVVLFVGATSFVESMFGPTITRQQAEANPDLIEAYAAQARARLQIPRIIFFLTSVCTIGMLGLLYYRLPDFPLRGALWVRTGGRPRLRVYGQENLAQSGPIILASDCQRFEQMMALVAGTDCYVRMIHLDPAGPVDRTWLRFLAKRAGLVAYRTESITQADWDRILRVGFETLNRSGVITIPVTDPSQAASIGMLLAEWQKHSAALVVPVHCQASDNSDDVGSVVAYGPALDRPASLSQITAAIQSLASGNHSDEHG